MISFIYLKKKKDSFLYVYLYATCVWVSVEARGSVGPLELELQVF